MSESTPAPAAVNSVPSADTTPPQADPAPKPEPGSVPYSRFAEVVEQRKGLESTLSSLIDGMVNELPEDVRDLVPNLPPAEKAAWIRNAQARGLFTRQTESQTAPPPASSPDAKRPSGKPVQDFNGATPFEMLRAGYGQQER